MPSSVSAGYPQQLCKRDGSIVPFDLGKIRDAIAAAGQACGEFDVGYSTGNGVLVRSRPEKSSGSRRSG